MRRAGIDAAESPQAVALSDNPPLWLPHSEALSATCCTVNGSSNPGGGVKPGGGGRGKRATGWPRDKSETKASLNPLAAAALLASETSFSCSMCMPSGKLDLTLLLPESRVHKAGGEGVRDCTGLRGLMHAEAGDALRDVGFASRANESSEYGSGC